MFKIKTVPEDFIVKEIFDLKLKEKGDYSYFLLKKENTTTLDAIKIICKRFNLNSKSIGFSGNKDKRALTEQYISIYRFNENKDFEFKNFSLKFIGLNNERINLGIHKENEFIITIRNLDREYNIEPRFIVNYFDEQRFSINNFEIGKLILQRKFSDVCNLLNVNLDNLRKNRRILRFYIHSLQGYLFNYVLSSYLNNKYKDIKLVRYSLGNYVFVREEIKNFKLPLISFDVKFDKRFSKYFDKILKDLKIKKEDFLIREMPELIDETVYRDCIAKVKDFKIVKYEKDELNNGKFKEIISFRLTKGSYATILIKEYFD